ncbi:MAG: hypothetical protein AB7T49_06625 [Oligoflexales bacterium]
MNNSASSGSQKVFVVRIMSDTKDALDQIMAEANNKEIGNKVKPENVIALALSLIKKDNIEKLKAATLTNSDKLELRYREYIKMHGPMTKDDFLGCVLRGEVKDQNTNSP